METYRHNRLTIELHNDEVDTMRELVRLAHQQLVNSPCIQMKGSPLERQAGLVGPELFRAKQMLEKLGKDLGVEFPADATPDNDDTECVRVNSWSIYADSPEEAAESIAKVIANVLTTAGAAA